MAKPKTTGGPIHLCTLGAYKGMHWLIPEHEIPFWQDFLDVVFEHTERVPTSPKPVSWVIWDSEDRPHFKFYDTEVNESLVDDEMLEAGNMVYQHGLIEQLKDLSHAEYAELYSVMVADVREP